MNVILAKPALELWLPQLDILELNLWCLSNCSEPKAGNLALEHFGTLGAVRSCTQMEHVPYTCLTTQPFPGHACAVCIALPGPQLRGGTD